MVASFDKNSKEIRNTLAEVLQELEINKRIKKADFLEDQQFSTNSPFSWTGNFKDFSFVIKKCHIYNNKEDLFLAEDFSEEFVKSTQNWTYSQLVGSCFFRLLENSFSKVETESRFSGTKIEKRFSRQKVIKNKKEVLKSGSWFLFTKFILNKNFGEIIVKILERNDIFSFSKKENVLMGISDSLLLFKDNPIIEELFPKEESWYRLLHFLGIENPICSELVKNVIQAKNTSDIIKFLKTADLRIPKKKSLKKSFFKELKLNEALKETLFTELFVSQRDQLKDFTFWDACNSGEDVFSKTSNLFFGDLYLDLFFSDLYFEIFKKFLKEDPQLFI